MIRKKRAKQLPDLALARGWPRGLLQGLPSSWKRGYLFRQSGGVAPEEAFHLADRLQGAKRFLFVWPEKPENLLLAFPAMQALRTAVGQDSARAHFVPKTLESWVADLFPGEQIFSWSREKLAWHDPAMQAVRAALRSFAPQAAVNLMHPGSTVISALIRASGAGLRAALEDPKAGAYLESYTNLRFQSNPETPWAGRYFQILNPWRYAGFSLDEHWPILEAASTPLTEAWMGLATPPERTWLYVHDASDPLKILDDDFYSWLWEKIQARESGDVSLALGVLNPPDAPLVREGRWRGVPVLKASGLSEFSALASPARGVAAFQGTGLHIAGLSGVRCLAFLRRDEAAYDVSAWNKLFEVEWITP